MAPTPIPSTCFVGGEQNDFELYPCYEHLSLEEPILTPGMTSCEYMTILNELMTKEDAANLERAKYVKVCRSFSSYELENLNLLSPKDLSHIARIEHFSETRMGIDMLAWCQEVIHRIRNELFQNGDLNSYDMEIIKITLIDHAFFGEVSKTEAFRNYFYSEEILNIKTGRLF